LHGASPPDTGGDHIATHWLEKIQRKISVVTTNQKAPVTYYEGRPSKKSGFSGVGECMLARGFFQKPKTTFFYVVTPVQKITLPSKNPLA